MATPVICMAGSQELVRLVKDWDISDENWEVFKEVIANSKKESELECLLKKQLAKTKKLSRHEHFLNHDMFFLVSLVVLNYYLNFKKYADTLISF